MKNIFFLSVILILWGCHKSQSPPPASNNSTQSQPGINQVTYLNGSCGYNNTTFSINPVLADYSLNQNISTINQQTINIGAISIHFPGTNTGTFLLTNTLNSLILVNTNDNISTCPAQTVFLSDSVVLHVTRYDAVGGLMEGTWGGRLKLMADSTQKLNASGKFSAIRGADQ